MKVKRRGRPRGSKAPQDTVKKHQVNVRLTSDLHEELQRRTEGDESAGALIRTALRAYFAAIPYPPPSLQNPSEITGNTL